MSKENGEVQNKKLLILLWITIMNQSQDSKSVLCNIEELCKRIPNEYEEILVMSQQSVKEAMRYPSCLHRFPNKMATYLYDSLVVINTEFERDVNRVFNEPEDIIEKVQSFKSVGLHKARICNYIYMLISSGMECINCEDIRNLGWCIKEQDSVEEISFLREVR